MILLLSFLLFASALPAKKPEPDRRKIFRQQLELINRKYDRRTGFRAKS